MDEAGAIETAWRFEKKTPEKRQGGPGRPDRFFPFFGGNVLSILPKGMNY
jgi:hypothetical protein